MARLRNIIFKFLWSGAKEKEMIHLANWKFLDFPKEYGGWGLKNLSIFGVSLAAKSMWHDLLSSFFGCDLFKTKYINRISMINWLRDEVTERKKCLCKLEMSSNLSKHYKRLALLETWKWYGG